ncbi:hypothetical protein ACFL35_18460, partial [Candidatus Riflebacteria bacterium]
DSSSDSRKGSSKQLLCAPPIKNQLLMMKKIFNIPTLFILSGLIALFLMPGEMMNAKTRAQYIKDAEAALAKAYKTKMRQNDKYKAICRILDSWKKKFKEIKKKREEILKNHAKA